MSKSLDGHFSICSDVIYDKNNCYIPYDANCHKRLVFNISPNTRTVQLHRPDELEA